MENRFPTSVTERISEALFREGEPVPTLVPLVHQKLHQRGRILLVRPAGAPEGWFVPPQGHMEWRPGVTLLDEVVRIAWGKLGIQPAEYRAHDLVNLFEVVHSMPKAHLRRRGDSVPPRKRLVFVWLPLQGEDTKIELNPAVAIDHQWVWSWEELDGAMECVAEEGREPKCLSTCRAIAKAARRGLLEWPVPEHMGSGSRNEPEHVPAQWFEQSL